MRKIFILSGITLIAWVTVNAQIPGVTYEKLLVPVVVVNQPMRGANGSLWATTFVARNNTDNDVAMYPILASCQTLCAPAQLLPARRTASLTVGVPGEPGALLFVDASKVDDISLALRAQDLSRQSQTWGTDIPIVRDREFRAGGVILVGIPTASRFRNTLRIYDPDNTPNAQVTITLWRITGNEYPGAADELIGQRTYALLPPIPGQEWHTPAWLQLGDLSEIAPIGLDDRLVVQVVPATPGMRIWAFDSVTNNETQHVTLVVPR